MTQEAQNGALGQPRGQGWWREAHAYRFFSQKVDVSVSSPDYFLASPLQQVPSSIQHVSVMDSLSDVCMYLQPITPVSPLSFYICGPDILIQNEGS